MGNCQAAEAATAVLQHPDGKIERLYWPTTADEVMRANPGHYIALATTLNIPQHRNDNSNSSSTTTTTTTIVRLTKLRLLRSKETLALGHVYRLVTSKEVMKALEARKQERLRKQQKHQQQQSQKRVVVEEEDEVEVKVSGERPLSDQMNQEEAARIERHKQKTAQSAARARQWRPSLHSISEAVS